LVNAENKKGENMKSVFGITVLVAGILAGADMVNAQTEPVPSAQAVALNWSAGQLHEDAMYMVAQSEATEYVRVGSASPLETAKIELPGFLKTLTDKYSWLGTVLILVGALRVVIKPLVSAVRGYIASTPDPADDAWLAKVESSVVGKIIIWTIDYLTSIKLTGVKR